MSKYSTAHVEAMKTMVADTGPLTLAKCQELAESDLFAEAGITAKSIIAKARVEELPYEKVVRKTKAGKAIRSKATIVEAIEDSLGLPAGSLPSVTKASKIELELIEKALLEG